MASKSKTPKRKHSYSTRTPKPRNNSTPNQKPRTPKPSGIKVWAGKIYDPQNGRSCHQCRQKIIALMASCKNHHGGKACPFLFCDKCLFNRYGEEVVKVEKIEDWKCPKCRGVCNCSICMKKRGCKPIGKIGFSSATDMHESPENEENNDYESSEELTPPQKLSAARCGKLKRESDFDGRSISQSKSKTVRHSDGQNSSTRTRKSNAKNIGDRNSPTIRNCDSHVSAKKYKEAVEGKLDVTEAKSSHSIKTRKRKRDSPGLTKIFEDAFVSNDVTSDDAVQTVTNCVTEQHVCGVGSTEKPRGEKASDIRASAGKQYDPENRRSCHQCRQKIIALMASCKNQDGGRKCPFLFCEKCLSNRYGEDVETVEQLEDWKCPKCRGICNCSICMRKRGCKPTGKKGISSVFDVHGSSGNEKNDANGPSEETISPRKELTAVLSGKRKRQSGSKGRSASQSKLNTARHSDGKNSSARTSKRNSKNISNGGSPMTRKCDSHVSAQKKISETFEEVVEDGKSDMKQVKSSYMKTQNTKRNGAGLMKMFEEALENHDGSSENAVETVANCVPEEQVCGASSSENQEEKELNREIVLPDGIDELKVVADVEVPAEDMGHALQFLQFCEAFGEVLNMKEGQPEAILREVISGRSRRIAVSASVAQFYMQLLSLIGKDAENQCLSKNHGNGEDSWVQDLNRFLSESNPLELESVGGNPINYGSYDTLNPSAKLRVLNYLCDEVLATKKLREWVDEKISESAKRKKQLKLQIIAEENDAKKKLRTKIAEAILERGGTELTASEYSDILSGVETELAESLSEANRLMNLESNLKQPSDLRRTAPFVSDRVGRRLWKLRGYSLGSELLLQDIADLSSAKSADKWSFYDATQKEEILKLFPDSGN